MQIINKWVAKDGSEWKTEEDAVNHEIFLDKIEKIESILPENHDTSDFVNGHGYVQHSQSDLLKARSMLVDLACEYVYSKLYECDIRSYTFGRYLNDNNYHLYNLYYRIVLCIDDNTWREYGQPFYALHPDKAYSINE
jgi:hypothetical protein